MQPSRESAAQPQQPPPPPPPNAFSRNQYYEIGQSTMSLAESVRQSESLSAAPAHIHPINLCSGNSTIISQQQLREMLPGTVFGDHPSMAHLHYHIVPSRRVIGNCTVEPVHHHQHRSIEAPQQQQQHYDSHYQRHSQIIRPVSMLRSAPSCEDLDKERDNHHLNHHRYSQLDRNDKMKNNMSLLELSNESQASITESKGKCQCHMLYEQTDPVPQRRIGMPIKRDLDDDDQDNSSLSRQPPALPPRPPPRPANRHYELPSTTNNQREQRHVASEGVRVCCKKYVVLCWLCGGLSVAVGSLFLLVHAVLSANTASLALFETVPSYIPGTMLIFIGLCTMSLARRKYRYGSLMKICGSVSIVCALVCVLVTVTTTVVHMSRLQSLHECVYTTRAKLCTCYSASQSHGQDQGVLFEGTPHCEAVHGALYTCLRTLFGVSVAGILACIFSCMLVYQLHRHEKKKMYWEQLELRCRSLYGQGAAAAAAAAAGLVGNGRPAGTCGCCNDCGGGIGPWWAQSPGNLYTPNPDLTPARRWRLPWSRSRGPAPSADSNYGFQSQAHGNATNNPPDGILDNAGIMPYGILGPAQSTGPYSVLQASVHDDHHYGHQNHAGASPYSVLEAAVPLWGPPPPYSDPNSPARRFVYRTNEHRARPSKRIDSFPLREVEYNNRTSEIKRQGNSNNYENAEPLSAISTCDTDTEPGEACEARLPTRASSSKHKKQQQQQQQQQLQLLKGVENAAFQEQESSVMTPKQSESELYFGDVSSCCGPESSLYDVATDKEGQKENCCQSEASTSYQKRSSSKRSRRHHQQQQQQQLQQQQQQQQPQQQIDLLDLPSNSSCSSNCDDMAGIGGPSSYSMHTAADIEYEVIRENNRYDYEAATSGTSFAPRLEINAANKQEEEEMETTTTTKRDDNSSIDDEEAYAGDKEVEESKEAEGDDEEEEEEEFGEFRSSFHEDVRPVKV